jgi:serine/threonine protein kinase
VRALPVGARFGGYEILGMLGEGGVGRVYRARRVGAQLLEVALKIVEPPTPADAARFDREADAIARLRHPNIVRGVERGAVGSRRFIALELVAGPTLGEVLADEGQLGLDRALAIARDVLAALAHAHARGVIHRDVKPDNVIVAARGAVLVDFGLAALRDAGPLTAAGTCVGSPSYIAPERLLGHPHDARSDVYAVGVMLYEMLAGLRPFVGASAEEIMQLALARPPRPLRVTCPDLPPTIEALVARALAKDPTRRFEDAAAMLWSLVDARDAPAPSAPPDDGSAATTHLDLAPLGSWWSRFVAWLRYGRWRWRARETSTP